MKAGKFQILTGGDSDHDSGSDWRKSVRRDLVVMIVAWVVTEEVSAADPWSTVVYKAATSAFNFRRTARRLAVVLIEDGIRHGQISIESGNAANDGLLAA